MKIKKILLATIAILLFSTAFAQQPNCCDTPACKRMSEMLAVRVAGVATFVKSEQDAPAKNKATLDSLKNANPELYNTLITVMQEAAAYMNSHRQGDCFMNSLPSDIYDNAYNWIIYFNDIEHPVRFPSTEFCGGWKKRFEINQGAANVFKKSMTYSGSLRGYLMYTFGKKDSCGNKIRMLLGPAVFLRGNTSYITMSTRAAFRIKDIAPKNFAVGNLNLFAEYNTNFSHFTNIAAGFEVELGPFGLNFAVNLDTKTQAAGFLAGLVFANKKLN